MGATVGERAGIHFDQRVAGIHSSLRGVGAEKCGGIDLGREYIVRTAA